MNSTVGPRCLDDRQVVPTGQTDQEEGEKPAIFLWIERCGSEQTRPANISTYDVIQSNGVIHVIDTVVMP